MALPERTPQLDPQRIESAEKLVAGKDLAPEAIRSILEQEGFEDPIIEHVARTSMLALKKYKSSVVKTWNS